MRTTGVLKGQVHVLRVLKRCVERNDVLVLQLAMDPDLPLHLRMCTCCMGTWVTVGECTCENAAATEANSCGGSMGWEARLHRAHWASAKWRSC